MTSLNNEALISIIVPVYQVKEYITDCIESLVRQTYQNLEILLIDDGSTDGSGQICDQYAAQDERIQVVHQQNRGLSGARNTGLGLAKGEYIAFVDSDDMVLPSFIERLYELMQQYHADIAVCDYVRCRKGIIRAWQKSAAQGEKDTCCMPTAAMLQEWHGKRKNIETMVWNKLYSRKLFGENGDFIRFPEGTNHEDVYVSHLLVAQTENVAITGQKLYLYRVRKGSIKNSRLTENAVGQNIEAQLNRMAFFEENGMQDSFERLAGGFLLHLVMYDYKLKGRQDISEELKQKLRKLFMEYYPKVKRSKELKVIYKVVLRMYAIRSNKHISVS